MRVTSVLSVDGEGRSGEPFTEEAIQFDILDEPEIISKYH